MVGIKLDGTITYRTETLLVPYRTLSRKRSKQGATVLGRRFGRSIFQRGNQFGERLRAIGVLRDKYANGCICLSPGILAVRKEVSGLCERRFDVSGAAGQGQGGEQLLLHFAGHGLSFKGFLFC